MAENIIPNSNNDLKRVYRERLKATGITSLAALEEALKKGEVDLTLRVDDFILPERQKEILEQNPDSWQVGEQLYPVIYGEPWSGKFLASVEMPAKEVLLVKEFPPFLQGRAIRIHAQDIDSVLSSDDGDLEQLKFSALRGLVDYQWKEWERENKESTTKKLENFDLNQPLPELPPPLEYGKDPVTGGPLLAYPAIVAGWKSIYFKPTYSICYFQNRTQANLAQDSLERNSAGPGLREIPQTANLANTANLEREQGEKALADLEARLTELRANPTAYDIPQMELNYLIHDLKLARFDLTHNWPIQFRLERMRETITKFELLKRERDEAKDRVAKAIEKYCSTCPLCNQPIKEGKCINPNHNTDLIKWNVDEDGNNIGPAKLSQIETSEGKIVAAIACSLGTKNHPKGEVYLATGESLGENHWQNEPIASELVFKDLKKILTPEQVERWREYVKKVIAERKAKKRLDGSRRMLNEAEKKVKEGLWKKGKFTEKTDARTGEARWVGFVTVQGGALEYIVNPYSPQPSSSEKDYYFSRDPESIPRSSQGGIQIIQVNLEHPLPEEKTPSQ